MNIIKIREHREMSDKAAEWFHTKWGIPLAAYTESIGECLKNTSNVPQWYVAIQNDKLVGGLGVIENERAIRHFMKDMVGSLGFTIDSPYFVC